MSPFSSLLSQAALSATKVLERGEDQAKSQMQNLLISQEGMQTADEIYNSNAGVRDTVVPFRLAKMAFLTFLVAGNNFFIIHMIKYGSYSRYALGCEGQG